MGPSSPSLAQPADGKDAAAIGVAPLTASLLALALALALALSITTAAAWATPCPGAISCPYVAAQVIGQRAEGVLRFPEAVAVDAQGNVYVADQLSYVVQKFSPAGDIRGEWGSYGGGHGQFGPIGGIATDAASNVYVVDSSHNRIQKFDTNGNFLTAWGHQGSEVGEFNFGSSQNYTKPPGGGIAVAGNYVYVADSGNDRIERFNLSGGEGMAWGTKGSGLGQFSYPRGVAANETRGDRQRRRQPSHRAIRTREALSRRPSVPTAPAGGSSASPTGWRWTRREHVRRRRHQPPRGQVIAAARPSSAPGAALAPNRDSSPFLARWRATPRGIPT